MRARNRLSGSLMHMLPSSGSMSAGRFTAQGSCMSECVWAANTMASPAAVPLASSWADEVPAPVKRLSLVTSGLAQKSKNLLGRK